jgi:environmental stress-induced protein Ves
MKIEHIKASKLTTNQWSGGTTTQLAIYPKNAEYKERNFQFRISTATVESEESTFTRLPGVLRKLMILDGEIRIEHKNQHSKTLKKFDQDEFSGDWDTKSHGKATDFNVMTTGNTFGDIEAITLQKGERYEFWKSKNLDFLILYAYKGPLNFKTENHSYSIEKGDVLIIDSEETNKFFFVESMSYSEIIITRISIKK